jgi:hypothetical protein
MKQNRIKLISFSTFVLIALFAIWVTPSAAFGETVEKGIIILVEFPDVKHDVDKQRVQVRFSQQLNNYVREMSYNKVSLEIDVTKKWYKMPGSVRRPL